MQKNLRKLSGISLFEMLLVMVIISMIVVAGIRYVKHQQEISAAKAYGVKLYTFGQAVNSYVTHSHSLRTSNLASLPGPDAEDGTPTVNNDPNIVVGTDPATGAKTITVSGTSWLKRDKAGTYNNVPFLDDNFTFNSGMSPLTVGKSVDDEFKKGDEAFSAVISFVDPENPMTSAYSISINAGVLYKAPTGNDAPVQPLPALTADAIKHANELYTSYQGAAAIIYSLPPVGDGTPPTEAQGTLSTIAQKGDAFLRIDGNNYMEGPVRFNPETVSMTALAAIENVNVVNFHEDTGTINNLNKMTMINAQNSASEISSLSTLNFVSDPNISSEIKNLKTLAFTPGLPPTPARAAYTDPGSAEITGLNRLAFDTTANTLKEITNLNTLTFLPNDTTNTIKNVGNVEFIEGNVKVKTLRSVRPGTPADHGDPLKDQGRILTPDNSSCGLAYLETRSGADGQLQSCNVKLNENNQWAVYRDKRGASQEKPDCTAVCIVWGF